MNISDRAVRENKETLLVKVKVKLTNSIDEGLVYRGFLEQSQVHVYETEAFVDMTNVHTVLPMDLVEKLGLDIMTQRVIYDDDGNKKVGNFADPVKIEVEGRETTDDPLIAGDKMTIGRIALRMLDLVVDEENQRLIPNPEHPNGPVFRI